MPTIPQDVNRTRRELIIMHMKSAHDSAQEAIRHMIAQGTQGEADAAECLKEARGSYLTAEGLLSRPGPAEVEPPRQPPVRRTEAAPPD